MYAIRSYYGQNEEANEISNRVFNHELRRSIYEYIPKIDVSTKASENETWGKLFWGDRPFFSGRESLLLRGRPASFNEKFPVVLQTITLTQKSSYDLDVSITQFQLFARDNNLYVTTIELNNLLPFDSEKSVITSYSIHYTKLYDILPKSKAKRK